MIRIIQSYADPVSIGESTVIKTVSEHFKGQVLDVPFYDKKNRGLSKKEMCKFGFKAYDEAQKGDVMFGWGSDVLLYTWLKSKLGGVRN